MHCERLAKRLFKQGIKITSHKEGDIFHDGNIVITDRISVQVASDGSYANVVCYCDKRFTFYKMRRPSNLKPIINDIQHALIVTE